MVFLVKADISLALKTSNSSLSPNEEEIETWGKWTSFVTIAMEDEGKDNKMGTCEGIRKHH